MRTSNVLALGLAILAGCDGRDSALTTPGSSAGRDPYARTPLTELTRANLVQDDALTAALALGDVDRDGDLDLVVANDGLSQLMVNDGQASFTAAPAGRLPQPASNPNPVVHADHETGRQRQRGGPRRPRRRHDPRSGRRLRRGRWRSLPAR
jgi:hypothetical protein